MGGDPSGESDIPWDRGVLSKEQFAAWQKQRAEAEEQVRRLQWKNGKELPETPRLKEAMKACADLRRRSLMLGYKTSWLATRSDDVAAVVDWFGFSQVEKTEWHGSTIPSSNIAPRPGAQPWTLITPPCGGVIYIKCTMWDLDYARMTSLMPVIDVPLRAISEYGSSVYFLWSFRGTSEHGYAVWEHGDLKRAVLSSDFGFDTLGDALAGEPEPLYFDSDDPLFYLDESSIFEAADAWDVNQLRIRPLEPDETAYCWIADIPFWLR